MDIKLKEIDFKKLAFDLFTPETLKAALPGAGIGFGVGALAPLIGGKREGESTGDYLSRIAGSGAMAGLAGGGIGAGMHMLNDPSGADQQRKIEDARQASIGAHPIAATINSLTPDSLGGRVGASIPEGIALKHVGQKLNYGDESFHKRVNDFKDTLAGGEKSTYNPHKLQDVHGNWSDPIRKFLWSDPSSDSKIHEAINRQLSGGTGKEHIAGPIQEFGLGNSPKTVDVRNANSGVESIEDLTNKLRADKDFGGGEKSIDRNLLAKAQAQATHANQTSAWNAGRTGRVADALGIDKDLASNIVNREKLPFSRGQLATGLKSYGGNIGAMLALNELMSRGSRMFLPKTLE